MSEIWFDSAGKPIDVPLNAVAWRVRHVAVGRGRPQLVYGRDGLPLYVPIAGGLVELRRTVENEGPYWLDPVDDQRRPIQGAPTAYVAPWDMPAELAPDEPGAELDELAALARTASRWPVTSSPACLRCWTPRVPCCARQRPPIARSRRFEIL